MTGWFSQNWLEQYVYVDRVHRTVKPDHTYSIMGPTATGIHPAFEAELLNTLRLKGLQTIERQKSDENSS